ncbi:MAG: TIGR01777 family oxidoreductase [Planctomycetota bacterium]|jgi:uncharacterized protein (TIGR01777 family)
MRVAVTGATGLLGRALAHRLLDRGDEVVALTRDPDAARERLPETARAERWVVGEPGPLAGILSGLDGVVNLAGENVLGRRWRATVKEELRRSRVEGTRTVVRALEAAEPRPRVLVNASATGYYGPRGDEEVAEDAPPGTDFLAEMCVAWEEEAAKAESFGVRVARVRTGIVLSTEGGALPSMVTPFRWFVGGRIGHGRQWVPWIHVDDLTGLLLHALDREEVEGPLNGTAPHPVSNREFVKALGRTLRRPSWLPVPRLALRILLGEAGAVVATGQRAVPRRALDTGFDFGFSEVESALADLLTDR